ncbi:hypothetical protein HW115_12405 [Verrucomicrobiaceae bacterium N1E253]|uniref:Porin n=1 Tax=Oceaniferula marina TaxID=2748318 RepID=A0A851GN14_9BACT|nr:porin [Oceaniferula marina]NWK56417.1 hypothetical protein [Oceaniferula marina]
MKYPTLYSLFFTFITCFPLSAGEQVILSKPPADTPSSLDRLWGYATLYQNENNPVIQKFVLSGRLHADAIRFDEDPGNFEDMLWRRFRFGFKSSWFDHFTLQLEADIDLNDMDSDELDDSYNRLTDAYIGWSRSKALAIKLGKQSAGFTLDGATSSKKLLTPERSTVATNLWFPTEYFTGISTKGRIDHWSYQTGAFSSSDDEEFGTFDSGYFGLISLGYDFKHLTGCDRSEARIDYVYNDPDYDGNVGTRDLRQVVSLSAWWENQRAGIATGLSFGDGIEGQSDLYGLEIMPYYTINDTWQLVFRYTYVYSPDDNGVRLNRYESQVVTGRCNAAHEWFLGINTYFYGHKLKWQNGIEYIHTNDRADDGGEYSGWGLTSAFRMYF